MPRSSISTATSCSTHRWFILLETLTISISSFPTHEDDFMTEKKGPQIAADGYSKPKTLVEGYLRKGGSNAAVSQVQTRPPAPAPMKPAASQEAGAAKPMS